MASVGALLMLLPVAWTCSPQKADYVMVSCFPNAIIANVPECPYGWEIDQLSLGGVCYSGIHSPGYYRFIISDLTPKNHSYCGTQSEYMPGKDPKYVFYNSIVSNDTSLTVRNQPVNYTFNCMYRAAYLVNNAVFSQRFKVVLNNCWATPTPYSTDKKRWSLIINSCSSDHTVTIFENAKDSRSMFKFNSFRFQRLEKVSTVWLHCEVQVCDGERLVCQPAPCSVRSLSSEAAPSGGILTAEFHIKGIDSSNNGHIKGTSLFILLAVLINTCCDLVNGSRM
ncbi:hypothetical protein EPR50_G00211500 [Perca flavescens]|uniref:ZP domain-containing protein n=1 Tax=Perca flavescens TaxID=8167 RepID=A0A484C290_PERFV|nr:hypothetical protein EPR50_G00211500 [Perca flavescens]